MLARNYHENNIFLSQAPGPNYNYTTDNIITFDRTDRSLRIDTERSSWEDTWAGTFRALPERDDGSADMDEAQVTGSGEDDENGLSTSAIAGIAVAIALTLLVILGLVLWRFLRRRKARKTVAGDAGQGLMASPQPQLQEHYSTAQSRGVPVEKQSAALLHEADAENARVEIGQGRADERVELDGNEGMYSGPQRKITVGER